jgi:hypothetical protein
MHLVLSLLVGLCIWFLAYSFITDRDFRSGIIKIVIVTFFMFLTPTIIEIFGISKLIFSVIIFTTILISAFVLYFAGVRIANKYRSVPTTSRRIQNAWGEFDIIHANIGALLFAGLLSLILGIFSLGALIDFLIGGQNSSLEGAIIASLFAIFFLLLSMRAWLNLKGIY